MVNENTIFIVNLRKMENEEDNWARFQTIAACSRVTNINVDKNVSSNR